MITLARPEGTNVTLNMTYKLTAGAVIAMVEWSNSKLIMSYFPGSKLVIQPPFEEMVKFDNNTLSLELMNIKKNDSGVYTGVILETEGTSCTAKYNLSVVGMY